MPVTRIACDVCGGPIQIKEGGKMGVCPYCQTEYMIERLREIANGSRISVTGSDGDIIQWKSMLDVYLDNCDYTAAESTARKILEANPQEESTLEIYKILQGSKMMDIQDGVLMRYSGMSENVIVPRGIKAINDSAFLRCKTIKSITLPDSVSRIGDYAFRGCTSLEHIIIPDSVRSIGKSAFWECFNLHDVQAPSIFCNPNVVNKYFGGTIFGTNTYHVVEDERRTAGLCPYCGGNFNIFRTCKGCGRPRDY